MTPIVKAILEKTYTTEDLHRRLRLVQQVLEAIMYEERQQLRVTQPSRLRKQVLEEIADPIDTVALTEIDEQVWEDFTPTNLSTKMKSILTESESLPVMTLYIPVDFTDAQIAPLSEWARSNVEAGLLFDVHIDPKVVGGCAFVYKDRHFDWSLRRYLRSKRGLVTSLLNSYEE